MSIKIIGIIFVVASCGGFGFLVASSYQKEIRTLRLLISSLDYMECELQYRMTPLPDLCRQAASNTSGSIRKVFLKITSELEDQVSPDVEQCVISALATTKDIPKTTKEMLCILGSSLGRFDIDGQLKGLESVRQECRRNLELLTQNQAVRIRSYQTLGICAGAAIAILLI